MYVCTYVCIYIVHYTLVYVVSKSCSLTECTVGLREGALTSKRLAGSSGVCGLFTLLPAYATPFCRRDNRDDAT